MYVAEQNLELKKGDILAEINVLEPCTHILETASFAENFDLNDVNVNNLISSKEKDQLLVIIN